MRCIYTWTNGANLTSMGVVRTGGKCREVAWSPSERSWCAWAPEHLGSWAAWGIDLGFFDEAAAIAWLVGDP